MIKPNQDRPVIGSIIHGCTAAMLIFNVIWGAYLMYVTYSISPYLFGFALVATLLPCAGAAIYLNHLTPRKHEK